MKKQPVSKTLKHIYAAALVTVFASPAYAQLEKGTTMLNTLQTWLVSISALIVTFAVMFVGFRMAFREAQWKDVAPVFWGGVLVGGAGGIAAMLVG
ncbi:type IV secretion system protein VirB2 [Advenella incenata]|uniref:Type IV secretion system protein VirB2 n=1 Tax=Advenella incenata TaxID=267800 RepID=A0A4Q7V982_9BURK|nr:TrbC/VirB2 family protein [Advenella incenata]RZT91178.1 type IV secretion system protein VirB2 [Advenella incenata]